MAARLRLVCHRCRAQDIEQVMALGGGAFAALSGMTVDELNARLRRNADILTCLSDVSGDECRVRGFYTLYPLTPDAQRLVEAGAIAKSAHLTPEHIAERTDAAGAFYVSLVIGADRPAAAAVIDALRHRLLGLGAQGVRRLYARPASGSGARAVTRRGFVPIREGAGLYACDVGPSGPMIPDLDRP